MKTIAKNVKLDMVDDKFGVYIYYNSIPVLHIDKEDGTLVPLDFTHKESEVLVKMGVSLLTDNSTYNERVNIAGVSYV